MIARIKGVVIEKKEGNVIIEVGGVGIRVFVLPDVVDRVSPEEIVTFFTHLVVRENILDLYGFLKREELEIFELLISVSGIGPKGAVGVLAAAGPAEIKSAIALKDYSVLTKVSGIGKKTAERIVLELKSKIGKLEGDVSHAGGFTAEGIEALEALLALGYAREEAKKALQKVSPEVEGASEKVKQALRLLSKRN